MLALWHSTVLALALARTPLVPSRCGGVTMAAQTIRGSFLALRKKVKGTISPEQMDAITNVEQFAESTVQIAESKVQIAEEQKRSARKEVKLLEEKEELPFRGEHRLYGQGSPNPAARVGQIPLCSGEPRPPGGKRPSPLQDRESYQYQRSGAETHQREGA